VLRDHESSHGRALGVAGVDDALHVGFAGVLFRERPHGGEGDAFESVMIGVVPTFFVGAYARTGGAKDDAPIAEQDAPHFAHLLGGVTGTMSTNKDRLRKRR
jgi:hypothetical protein